MFTVLLAVSRLDISDRPAIPEYVRVHTPSVVTSDDLDDVAVKMQNLEFDIFTLVRWVEIFFVYQSKDH